MPIPINFQTISLLSKNEYFSDIMIQLFDLIISILENKLNKVAL